MGDSAMPISIPSNREISGYAEIIVVRHGETAWNADGRIQGHLDVELNDVGRQQAAAVADRLSKETAISAVYSSDLKRALETARTIASCCGIPEVIQDPDLRERHLGDLQGLTSDEALTLKPNSLQACRSFQEIPMKMLQYREGRSLLERCHKLLHSIEGKENVGSPPFWSCEEHMMKIVRVFDGLGLEPPSKNVVAGYDRNKGGGESFEQVYNRCTSSLVKIATRHVGEHVVVVTHGGVLRALHKRAAPGEELPGKILNASVNIFHITGEEWSIKTWGDINHLNKTGFLEAALGGDSNSG